MVTPDAPTVTLLVEEPDFRVARVEFGDHVEHVLEVRDGCDVLGVERWRRFEVNGAAMKALFKYLVRSLDKKEQQ